MSKHRVLAENDLAELAKRFRLKSGKTKAELARHLGVTRATMQDAEERPEISLTKLRCRIIEECSPYRVVGPCFMLKQKRGSGRRR